MSELLEKAKKWLLDESKSYVIKETYLKRPRFVLVGAFYLLIMALVLFLASELVDWTKIFAPLSVFEPITKFFIDIDTGEPRNILGWVFIIGLFLIMVIILLVVILGLLLPGLYIMFRGSELTDAEWPADPERTKKWREKHAKK